ncbi:MAG: hypothetical protein M0R47_09655 [Methylobacter sp.]|uniref:hypothetical protein n=1 Tax=Methylobacter sp. TaxID=2051955 RepID=UPI00260089A2|nr:hypothetical protein [Methylobacter sp.]MCK9620785.1 hypothetical protein [Methylobacter sp.]
MNNMLRRSKTWLSFVLMLAVLGHFGLGHSDASAFVLCFGTDGHVAVERAGHDHGADTDKVYPTKAETGAYFTDMDSPCEDFPVVGDDHGAHIPLTDLSKASVDLGLLPLVFLVFLLIPYARVITRRSFFPDPLFTDSHLLAIRSTVLLI